MRFFCQDSLHLSKDISITTTKACNRPITIWTLDNPWAEISHLEYFYSICQILKFSHRFMIFENQMEENLRKFILSLGRRKINPSLISGSCFSAMLKSDHNKVIGVIRVLGVRLVQILSLAWFLVRKYAGKYDAMSMDSNVYLITDSFWRQKLARDPGPHWDWFTNSAIQVNNSVLLISLLVYQSKKQFCCNSISNAWLQRRLSMSMHFFICQP